MKDIENESDARPALCGWVKLWHPRGVQVSLPVPWAGSNPGGMLNEVTSYLDAGWLAQIPGLEAGENVEEIGWCVRKEHVSGDRVTPAIVMYSTNEGMKHKVLVAYLNNDEDEKAFESASGLSRRMMPLYEGEGYPERGKNPAIDRKIIRCPTPFRAVWVKNPRYDDETAAKATQQNPYTVAKKKFVRFDGVTPGKAKPAGVSGANGKPQGGGEAADPEKVQQWQVTLATDPHVGEVNQAMLALKTFGAATARACWSLIKEHAEAAGWVWDDFGKKWFVPERSPGGDETIPF